MPAAALLISVALLASQAEAQTPEDPRPPYTLAGVRRAAGLGDKPAEDPAPDESRPARPLTRPAARQQIDIAAWSPAPTVRLPQSDRLVSASLAPTGPAWHHEFLGMTQRDYGASPYDMMGNAERVQALATSMAFGLAIDGISRLVQHALKSYREGKVNRIRREIDAETAIVEQLYKESQAAKKDGPAQAPLRKAPR
jgi:hypothetical protein